MISVFCSLARKDVKADVKDGKVVNGMQKLEAILRTVSISCT